MAVELADSKLSCFNLPTSLCDIPPVPVMRLPVPALVLLALFSVAGCVSRKPEQGSVPPPPPLPSVGVLVPELLRAEKVETRPAAASAEATLEGYKRDLAQRISQVNSTRVYTGRPQALLRSVIVVKYAIDGQGNLVRSEILRTNRDKVAEGIALAALRATAPFPRPAAHLLRYGQVDLAETWLFNTDGRFQLRSLAQPQMDQ